MSTAPQNWTVGALSEKGPVRHENQDRLDAMLTPLGQLFIVADGMGGLEEGGRAAELAVDGICRSLGEATGGMPVASALRRAFIRTNRLIREAAASTGGKPRKMGSTAVLLLIAEGRAHVAHVGDSRAYLFRNGRLKRLTTDHTRAERMIAAGVLTREQARSHPDASILDHALGLRPDIQIDIDRPFALCAGDGILLCSDGLSGYVGDADIRDRLRKEPVVDRIPQRLFDLALRHGSQDNVTIQYIRIDTKRDFRINPMSRFKTAILVILVVLLSALWGYRHFFSTRSTLEADLAKAKQAFETSTRQLESIEIRKAELRHHLDQLNMQKETIEREIVQARNGLAQAEQDENALKTRVKNNKMRIETIKARLNSI